MRIKSSNNGRFSIQAKLFGDGTKLLTMEEKKNCRGQDAFPVTLYYSTSRCETYDCLPLFALVSINIPPSTYGYKYYTLQLEITDKRFNYIYQSSIPIYFKSRVRCVCFQISLF